MGTQAITSLALLGKQLGANLAEQLRKDVTTAGLSSTSQLLYYYLEQQAKNIYPVFYPILATTPRVSPTWGGQRVGGPGVNWKAVVAIANGGAPWTSEGNRNAYMNITTRNYSATFKSWGPDTKVTFFAQQAGLGFDDNLAIAQMAALNQLLNDEEKMILFGNSGPANVGGNGFALGTCATPVATTATTGGAIATGKTCSLFAVELTGWGTYYAGLIAYGLASGGQGKQGVQLPWVRQNADQSQDTLNGGTGIVSAASNVVTTGGGSANTVTGVVVGSTMAMGWAWFINSTDASAPTLANSYFAGVTSVPTIVITALPSTVTSQNGASTGANGTSLLTDNSWNTLDIDGISTWNIGTTGATQQAYLKNLQGAGWTSNGDGTVKEIEDAADYLWSNFKISIDYIYLGGSLIQSFSRAVLTSASGPGAQRLIIDRSENGEISGGQIVSEYHWKYSNTARAKNVPIRAHPWLPQGVCLLDLTTNPYPAAGNAIPAVRRMVMLEDHFAIRFPYTNLQHQLGTYAFGTLEHYLAFGGGLICGVANKVN